MVKDVLTNKIPNDLDFKNNCRNHQCSCCGSCCGEFLPLKNKDVLKIKNFLKRNPDFKPSFSIHDDTNDVYVMCPFLDEQTNKCRIYDIRPHVCRDFKCDRSKETLRKKRNEYSKNADYNGFFNGSKTASLHLIFFGEYEFDILWRHLTLKVASDKEFTFEEEQKLIPLEADKYLKEGGE